MKALFLGLFSTCMMFGGLSASAFADDPPRDRTQFGSNITVGPDETLSDVTCFGCSVRVKGHVATDVTVFGGSVIVEDQGEIGGDTTVFGGDLRLDKGADVKGGLTVFGGKIRRDPGATVGGDITNFAGMGWLFLIFGLPFAFLGAFVFFVVWLIRRLVRPAVPATAQA